MESCCAGRWLTRRLVDSVEDRTGGFRPASRHPFARQQKDAKVPALAASMVVCVGWWFLWRARGETICCSSAPGRGLFLWGPVGVENFYSRVSWRHQYNTPRSLRRRRQARGEKNSPVRRGRCAPTASLVHSFLNSSLCEPDMLHAMAGPFLLTLLGQQKSEAAAGRDPRSCFSIQLKIGNCSALS